MKHPHYLDGRALQSLLLNELADEIKNIDGRNKIGRLVSISIGDIAEASVYIRGQSRAAKKIGLKFEQQIWASNITQEDCKKRLIAMNDDPNVLGVILQRPTPKSINLRSLQSAIHPLKDVEGMNPASIGNIVYNDLALAPCTAAATIALIKQTGLNLKGLEVVMIGHSAIVGKPVAIMLMSEGATVTVCHHMTRSVASHSRRADVVIVAVGKPGLVGPDMIKPGAAVIDIGINQIKNEQGKSIIVGDVQTESVKDIASWITPVPGGVGPVTVAMLMQNAITAFKRQKDAGWL